MTSDLFAENNGYQPLAARMRPASLDDYVGQQAVVGADSPLRRGLDRGELHSLILWGPPGVGKTTLARLMASYVDAEFLSLSAVMSGVKDIREAVDKARQVQYRGGKTVLFIDEVHRFNKSQQDAFLPYVEDGTVIFVGATTENPSFELNNALLSRAQVYVLSALSESDLLAIATSALQRFGDGITADQETLTRLARAADGDGRKLLNLLELALQLADGCIDEAVLQQVLRQSLRRFDKGGDDFYEQISALHKSVRGSDPDASLYWLCRMLDGGCDPLYIARRVVRMASEDIGNADPRALTLCCNAWDVQQRLGSPEGELAIAQAVVYLACAPKSNAVYNAYNQARRLVQQRHSDDVPVHLRNAPTAMMKDLGYGEEYRYAHDEPDAFAAGESYFPEALHGQQFYQPVERGLEGKIAAKLRHLRELNRQSPRQRYPESEP
ncbi:recombination factor protein RarA [Bacterioplanes sanyensis]|uniref:Replication-associated recombination protein A n=1 Tax=Bacterioplanes sanyensis TaxID=1249553 RepID=A0A222FL72_9GAMM|nr:replication-associated recombination protein A [Bacterioplanes sanyensis]ASP39775.1 recombination factor protein RarA [Bacterioplanes sanyensis]